MADDDLHCTGTAKPASVQVIPGGSVCGSVRPPGSKSLTNRALICAALAGGHSKLTGALRSEDTEVMIEALGTIGVSIEVSDAGRTLQVDSSHRPPLSADAPMAELFIANSGTSIRFLASALSAIGGHYRLHGVPRMHERPIGDLVDAIGEVIEGDIVTESPGGCPPVQITSRGWRGSQLSVAGSVSSQYLSGLMMAAPATGKPIHVSVVGELVSLPYVEMTARVMRSFGATVSLAKLEDASQPQTFGVDISAEPYRGTQYAIEPDASAASYFWAVAAITGGSVTVEGLTPDAIQGDVAFCEVLKNMGCRAEYGPDSMTIHGGTLRGIDVNMNAISDTVQTLAVVALFADGPTRVRGVAHNRFKETDRIGDLARELRKLGAAVEEHEDGFTIVPGELHGATLATYHDHRMAMSLSLAGLAIPDVRILDPACTSKTYPEFFADLERLIERPHAWA